MFDKVNLKKTVSSREQFETIIDTDFRTFTPEYVRRVVNFETVTVDQFFKLYEDLYLEIPSQGSTNSHEYLVQKSLERIENSSETLDMSRLLQELNDLRNQLIQANTRIQELQS
jgi:hypothetical protein